MRSGVASSDIVRSDLDLPMQDKSDFDAIENLRGESWRTRPMESPGKLGAHDVLLLGGGLSAAWLVQTLQQRGIRFVTRCDNVSGWPALRSFVRGAHTNRQLLGISIAATRAQAAPSTGITAPLTKLASSEARKSAAAAISSGRPKRPGKSVAS